MAEMQVEARYDPNNELFLLFPESVHWKGVTLSGGVIELTPEVAMTLRDALIDLLDQRSEIDTVYTLSTLEPLVSEAKVAGKYRAGVEVQS